MGRYARFCGRDGSTTLTEPWFSLRLRAIARCGNDGHRIVRIHMSRGRAASGLSTDMPGRMQAKIVIVPAVELPALADLELQGQKTPLMRVHKVLHVFQGERSRRTMAVQQAGARTARS